MKTIVMTGGGTAGHVMIAKILIPILIERGWKVIYVGSYAGLEREMIGSIENVDYYAISTGKLRRYFSFKNFTDLFRVLKGLWQAFFLFKKLKANVVFSGGGFVSVPVVLAAWLNKVPVVIRETDYSIGLANRICIPFSKKVCVTFQDTKLHLPCEKGAYFGEIIRPELFFGDRERALSLSSLNAQLPTILVMGGSLGSSVINHEIRRCLPDLEGKFNIIHLCGKGKIDKGIAVPYYVQYEFIGEELADFYRLADVVITRCGSNAICEGMLLRKPMLLIPLSTKNSRGDQLLNAQYAKAMHHGEILLEEDLTSNTLIETIYTLYYHRTHYYGQSLCAPMDKVCNQQIACLEAVAKSY